MSVQREPFRICKKEDCNKFCTAGAGRGWCPMHYQRWRKHGDPDFVLYPDMGLTECRIEGCSKPIKNKMRGLCSMHVAREKIHGDPLYRREKCPEFCTFPGCGLPYLASGWCAKHWERNNHHGDPSIVKLIRKDINLSFWSKVNKNGPKPPKPFRPVIGSCWIWTASIGRGGYGNFHYSGRNFRSHRYSYEQLVGPIPSGLVIDHLCRVRACCNPEHLEAVTKRENNLRGNGCTGINARKTHCPQGHKYTTKNTVLNELGHRRCRICVNEQWNRH